MARRQPASCRRPCVWPPTSPVRLSPQSARPLRSVPPQRGVRSRRRPSASPERGSASRSPDGQQAAAGVKAADSNRRGIYAALERNRRSRRPWRPATAWLLVFVQREEIRGLDLAPARSRERQRRGRRHSTVPLLRGNDGLARGVLAASEQVITAKQKWSPVGRSVLLLGRIATRGCRRQQGAASPDKRQRPTATRLPTRGSGASTWLARILLIASGPRQEAEVREATMRLAEWTELAHLATLRAKYCDHGKAGVPPREARPPPVANLGSVGLA
jgi:hypothetical protein